MDVMACHSPMSASQSSVWAPCLEVPLKKPLEEDSVTPLVKWSTSMSTSVLGGGGGGKTVGVFEWIRFKD